MEYQEILWEKSDNTAVITLNRPKRLNAFTLTMDCELFDALHAADADPEVRAIVITGAGRAFCAGADMDILTEESNRATPLSRPIRLEFHSLTEFLALKKPLIAAINGPCAGMALSLAAYCDLRVADETARMGLVFVRRGITPEDGVNWILPRLVGVGRAIELQITGRMVSAREALAMGLTHEVVPAGQAVIRAREIAAEIAAHCAPAAVAEAKRLAYAALSCELPTAVAMCGETVDRMTTTEDFKECVAAFKEGRPPRFVGR